MMKGEVIFFTIIPVITIMKGIQEVYALTVSLGDSVLH